MSNLRICFSIICICHLSGLVTNAVAQPETPGAAGQAQTAPPEMAPPGVPDELVGEVPPVPPEIAAPGIPGAEPLPAEKGTPKVVFSQTEYDFADVQQDQTVEHEFSFKNEGDGLLRIGKLKSSCGCTAALVSREAVEPGEEGKIKVTFRSGKFQGHVTKTVTVPTNAPDAKNVILKITGNVKVELEVKPQSIYLGEVRKKETVNRTVTITQPEGRAFSIKDISHKSGNIRVAATPEEPSAEHKLDITLDAPDKVGPFFDTISVKTDNEKQPEVKIVVRANVAGAVIVRPVRLFLGSVNQGAERKAAVEVEAAQGEPVNVLSAETDSDSFTAEVETIEEGKKYSVTVKLSEAAAAGYNRGSLKIMTDSDEQPVVTVPVSAVVRAVSK